MDDIQIAPSLKYSTTDAAPDTPNLTLSLELQGLSDSKIAKRNSNSGIIFRIHRNTDDHDQPCSFYWSETVDAWGSGGLVLLRHNQGQLERVSLPSEPWRAHDPRERIARNPHRLFELKPGESTWFFAGIPESWLDTMVSGEKYELLWPGGEIYWWAWGGIAENEIRSRDGLPRALLSGTPRVSFTVVEEPPAPLYETPRPKWPQNPAPRTPLFTVVLTGAGSMEMTDVNFQLVQTVTYRGLVSKDPGADPEPATQLITFDAFNLMIPFEWAFRSRGNSEWEYCQDQSVDCALTDLIYDSETAVNVGKDRRWISLAPGESWSQELEIDERLPSDLAPGDNIRYQLEGEIIKMWNWGSKEDHAQTVLMLPSGRDAGDWINRSPIVVPASNPLEFTIIS
ncbi:uncharacterized protein N7482_007309 [Penicillium canariense]|uniref:Uncharacterized protein n=1 Tax=Penicillium canariense TaxID=189055 RepID=A0A9W9HZB0_9EURO|nr:uncharacterized protein N7482_007309 [Penicillium canariense]KAJ5160305.1 hypothetical protein N7482_007309 [Penicillium canariense]